MNTHKKDKDLINEKELDNQSTSNQPTSNESSIVPDGRTKAPTLEEADTSQSDTSKEKNQQSVKDFLYKDAFLEGFIWE